jgi:hypothetical protein
MDSYDQSLKVNDLISHLFQVGVSCSSSTPGSSSGALAPALVANLPMQTHAMDQARKPAAAAGNNLGQPVELDHQARGSPRSPRACKKVAGK